MNNSATPHTTELFRPTLAWLVLLGFVFLSALFILAGVGKILNLVFPAGSLAVGVFLYFRYPFLYLSFMWWMWFLTPLVRRLADYKSSFTDPSPLLLAPYLVTAVTLVNVWQYLPTIYRRGGLAFILSFLGVFYGFCVGLIYRSPVQVGIALLEWLAPLLISFHFFVNWQDYPHYRKIIQRTFLWAVLVLGAYGIFQYLVAPEWDRVWLINADINSAGRPFPLEIRVWSTMNAPAPFGMVMMAGLLLLFNTTGVLYLPASAMGYLSFFLSRVRSAWGGWIIGFFLLALSLKTQFKIRLIVTVIIIATCVIPLTLIEPFSEQITSRFETLSNVENDVSAQARAETYQNLLGSALSSWFGEGLGSPQFDSAILAMLFSLGWFGTCLYMSGMLFLTLSLFLGKECQLDPFLATARAISLGMLAQLILGTFMLGSSGTILWGFLGIGIAGRKYYLSQNYS